MLDPAKGGWLYTVFTYEKIDRAYREVRRGKMDAPNQQKFYFEQEWQLFNILYKLQNHCFYPSPLRKKYIDVPKPRVAQAPSMQDKIVQHLICDEYATQALTRPLTDAATANRIGVGSYAAIDRLHKQLTEFWNRYHKRPIVLKADIHSFFASISHDRVRLLIDRYILDPDIKELMLRYLDMTDTGLPLGLQQNQLLANLYLSELDHIAMDKWGFHFYSRHMDDFYVLCEDESKVIAFLNYIEEYLPSIGLELNPKTSICYNDFDYLGFNFRITNSGKVIQRYAKSKRRGKNRHIKLLAEDFNNGVITPEQLELKYFGWRVHALRWNTRNVVLATDRKLSELIAPSGYEVRIIKHDTGNIRWRVTIVPIEK